MSKALKCICCGAPINRATMKCEYCGTEYNIENDIPTIRFETFTEPVKTYVAEVAFDQYYAETHGEGYTEFAIRTLAQQMMPVIASNMRISTIDDPWHGQVRLRGHLKVVAPYERGGI